jgi:hypothetical protein
VGVVEKRSVQSSVTSIDGVLDCKLRPDCLARPQQGAHATHEGVGFRELALVSGWHIWKTVNVGAVADDRRRVGPLVVTADGEGAAGQCGEDGTELAGAHARQQLLVEDVVKQVVSSDPPVRRVVVNLDGGEARGAQEGGQPIGAVVRPGEEDEHL